METILIKCPHCKEEMQAPADRESILCMFCGEKIDLVEVRKTVSESEKTADTQERGAVRKARYQENLGFVLGHTGVVCKDFQKKVRAFKKDSYAGLFETHKEENYAFYSSVKQILNDLAEEELEEICVRIAGAFIREQEEVLGQIRKKNDKFSAQMDKNMYLVIFVLPSIKEIQNSRADRLADVICEEWRKAFKDSNISAASYESIMQGFKRKLCYVTTAVCINLNKGEECEELQLIKEFRDGYLASTKEGQALIDEYYDIAPTLVKRIARDMGAQKKYVWLWDTYLAPCVAYIKSGHPENCKEVYCDMMESLRKEYMAEK